MARLRDRIPPTNSLVVFEVAARLLSFTRAAEELRVSQAAVSRQVQLLEGHLGYPLFSRHHRAIELTAQGERLCNAVTIGLEHIAEAVAAIKREQEAGDVTIASSVTFASYWLMSRIAKFRAHFPKVDVRLVASARMRDLGGGGSDLAIRHGRGRWPGATAHRLFGNAIFPVCSPAYLEAAGPFEELADLARATLLHLRQFDRNWVTWESWLEAFNVALPEEAEGEFFDNYSILIHAAVRGRGVALCGERLAEDLIGHGELVRPFALALPSDSSFYLLQPEGQPLRPDAERFRDWLLAEARGAGV
ncbi:MAG: LysR substrate-binding domain-containing protein [Kiloniellales bacterium]